MPGLDMNSLVPLLLLAGGGVAGGLSNRSGTTTGSQNVTQTPNLSPVQSDLLNQITGSYSKFLTNAPDLEPYRLNQIGSLNQNADVQKQNAQETLAARGISGGPAVGTALNSIDAQRFAGITNVNQKTPLLSNQLLQSALQLGPSIFNSIPTGSTTEAQSSSTSPSNVAGGTLSGLTSILALLYGMNAKNSGGGALGSLGQILGPILGKIFGTNSSPNAPQIDSPIPGLPPDILNGIFDRGNSLFNQGGGFDFGNLNDFFGLGSY